MPEHDPGRTEPHPSDAHRPDRAPWPSRRSRDEPSTGRGPGMPDGDLLRDLSSVETGSYVISKSQGITMCLAARGRFAPVSFLTHSCRAGCIIHSPASMKHVASDT